MYPYNNRQMYQNRMYTGGYKPPSYPPSYPQSCPPDIVPDYPTPQMPPPMHPRMKRRRRGRRGHKRRDSKQYYREFPSSIGRMEQVFLLKPPFYYQYGAIPHQFLPVVMTSKPQGDMEAEHSSSDEASSNARLDMPGEIHHTGDTTGTTGTEITSDRNTDVTAENINNQSIVSVLMSEKAQLSQENAELRDNQIILERSIARMKVKLQEYKHNIRSLQKDYKSLHQQFHQFQTFVSQQYPDMVHMPIHSPQVMHELKASEERERRRRRRESPRVAVSRRASVPVGYDPRQVNIYANPSAEIPLHVQRDRGRSFNIKDTPIRDERNISRHNVIRMQEMQEEHLPSVQKLKRTSMEIGGENAESSSTLENY